MVYKMKYILVTGGVMSGIEKGVIASSIGTMLKSCGHKVTAIKIDPDINVDTGIFAAYKHGEVFVLDDGGEVNLDLGNYERFLDIKLHRDNNITTGKICASVISKERKGDFLGKTVQMISHITNEIQNWVERVSLIPVEKDGLTIPEVCIIELGGKIDDRDSIPFIEAFCKLKSKVKEQNFCSVHVSFVPYPKATGEHKTKPTQASVRHIRGLGLSPDLIVCRSEKRMNNEIKIKVSNFCDVPPDQVICVHDVPSVYHVPLFLEEQGLVNFFHERLNMLSGPCPRRFMQKWCNLAQRINHQVKGVCIVLVGKYTFLKDAYASVTEALQHAGLYCNCKVEVNFIAAADLEQSSYVAEPLKYHEAWEKLYKSDGVLVPGGFGKRGVEGKIAAIEWARKNNKPFLGSYVQQMD